MTTSPPVNGCSKRPSDTEIRERAACAATHSPTVLRLREAMHQEVLVKARSFSPLAIWKTLRLGTQVDLAPLFEEGLCDDTLGEVPDCAACLDHCCQGDGSDIRLRLKDLAILKDANLLQGFVDVDEAASPKSRPLLSEALFPRLKRKQDGTCTFFSEGQCLVHAIRPLRCQRFPYRLHDDKVSIRFATRCRSRRNGSASERALLRLAVVDNYNAKLNDLVTLTHFPKNKKPLLHKLGLAEWLPKNKS